jgi:hypothetical protein
MEIASTIQSALDKVPVLITMIREFITKSLTALHLPASSSMLVFFVIAFFLAYVYLKQFITGSLWVKISTLINLILLALLIYVSIVYIK